jgi:hypothetical protein
MILEGDGLDGRWEQDADWCGKDGHFESEDRALLVKKLALVYLRSTHLASYKRADTSYRGIKAAALTAADIRAPQAARWRRLNRCIAENFAVMKQRGQVYWQKPVSMLSAL